MLPRSGVAPTSFVQSVRILLQPPGCEELPCPVVPKRNQLGTQAAHPRIVRAAGSLSRAKVITSGVFTPSMATFATSSARRIISSQRWTNERARMKLCPECGHRLGISGHGFCSHACRVVHRARLRSRRRRRWMLRISQFFKHLRGKREQRSARAE
jgi:hypothetical protein